jgi:Glycosyl hydrolases family 2, sugar binding domain/Glycosyl hydrolases family 2, TIM barrel domain
MLANDLPSPRQAVASLDGSWRFWPDLHGRLPTGPEAPFVSAQQRDRALGPARSATVPAPWQAQFDDLRLWAGTAWYERPFDPDPAWEGRRVRLCFGAVDYFCTVWVNDRPAGEHEGGYLPFAVDVTDLVRFDEPNTVTVRVLDVGPDDSEPFRFDEIPHGKQSWYGPIGGLWQGAWIESRGENLIASARVIAQSASGRIRVTARGAAPVRYRVLDPDDREVARGPAEAIFEVVIRDPIAWRPGAGAVYTLELESADDRWSTTFGFREVRTIDGRVAIDGVPVYVVGALDQDYWDGTIATPPSEEALARQMALARELGLNLLRCHVKAPTPEYLDAADRAGLMVWSEVPSWISLDDARSRVVSTLEGMIERDGNHPSLIAWTIVNEGWGTDLTGRAEDRAWLADVYERGKRLDPTRLWVDNSACPPTFHLRSDLNDFHLYRAVPDQLRSWQAWTAAWSADAARTISPHGDATCSGDEPRLMSEFGTWGLPRIDDADEPWWFETGASLPGDAVRPTGVRERFEAWGLGEVFGSWPAFVRESQVHQFEGLKAEIADLRLHPELGGYVITELTDVHWEANGLLDQRRNPKAFHDRLRQVTGQTVVIGRPGHTRYWSGERASVDVAVMSITGPLERRVSWNVRELGLTGSTEAPGTIGFDVPAVDRPMSVVLSLHADVGNEPVTDATKLWLFPHVPSRRPADVRVASRWVDVASYVERGGRAVVIAAQDDAVPEDGRIQLDRWSEDEDATGWLRSSGLGWLDRRLTDGLSIGPRVDLAFLGISPEHRIRGYGAAQHPDILAGHFLGWVRDVAATVAAFRHGEGLGLLCTFPLLDADGRDPVATAMMDRLVALASDRALAPTTRW